MHEPGKHVGPSRVEWDRSPGNGPLGGRQISEFDLDRLLIELKAPEEVSPAAGFYGRVRDRIETQRNKSIWGVFLQPMFGRRLALASAVLMLILGGALFVPGSEVDDQLLAEGQGSIAVGNGQSGALQPFETPDQDRNAVLVNLVTYQEH